MPRLMEKSDWMRTVENVSRGGAVWSEKVSTRNGSFSISLPESGTFHIFLVKVEQDSSAKKEVRSAREYIGCCKNNYPGLNSTGAIMKELREGEE